MIFYLLKELYLVTLTAPIFIYFPYRYGQLFLFCKPQIASGFFVFLSPCFGTAKVETFLLFPKYILKYFEGLFYVP